MSQQMPEQAICPQKRRGRPQKKCQPFFESGEQLFSLHDNIFHASILFYTFRIFDKTPSRCKFNPTIGFSVYEKMRSLGSAQKEYYDDDIVARDAAGKYADNFTLCNFFINSLTFGPSCVVDQFYSLFKYILSDPEIDPASCMEFIRSGNLRYINFNCSILQQLDVKTARAQEDLELEKLLEILVYTLNALKKGEKENKYQFILESEDDLFERGVNTKSKKKVKKE